MTSKWRIPEPPQFLEYSEVLSIINEATATSKHGERDRLVLQTLWESGGRISEVLKLTPERIGYNSLILPNLKQYRRKSKEEQKRPPPDKEVIVSEQLCNELKAYYKRYRIDGGTPVFRGNRNPRLPLNYRYVYRLVVNAADVLGIVRMKKYRGETRFRPAWLHLFRHANAMRILDETGDIKLVQRQLGHASIITTQQYAEVRPETARKALSQIKWRK